MICSGRHSSTSALSFLPKWRHRMEAGWCRSTGDGLFAIFDGPGRAIKAAHELREQLEHVGLPIRAGIHTGGGRRARQQDVHGIAVHLGARVMAEAGPNEILVSSTVRDLVAGSGLGFADRGKYSLEGIEGEWNLFAAVPDTYGSLTETEREILGLVGEGLSDREIGDRMSVSFTLAKIRIAPTPDQAGIAGPSPCCDLCVPARCRRATFHCIRIGIGTQKR